MPIANCIITPGCIDGSGNLIELWAGESNLSSDHMTINIITSSNQTGNKYKVMANLALPSIWSASDISALQIGLAKALALYYSLALNEIHVITTTVSSGFVVETGREITW